MPTSDSTIRSLFHHIIMIIMKNPPKSPFLKKLFLERKKRGERQLINGWI
jgi:hypothetical protein